MDKLIYTAFNTVNNIYDNRAVRAQNLANILGARLQARPRGEIGRNGLSRQYADPAVARHGDPG